MTKIDKISGTPLTAVKNKAMRAALYLRVSVKTQTVENQRLELEAAAKARGWQVVVIYADEGISGSKGRYDRPQLDAMLKDAVRRRFDVVMCWAVDRLGRSLPDLIECMQELRGAKVDLFMLQQGLDTSTPAGRKMFSLLSLFAEFERSMIVDRVHAGLNRARAAGVKLGRKRIEATVEADIRKALEAGGKGRIKIAKEFGVGNGTVDRIAKAMKA